MEREYSENLDQMSLACDDIECLVDDYIDGLLPVALKERVDLHLCSCSNCSILVKDISSIVELARGLDEDPLPLSIRERLRERLHEEVGYNSPQRKLTIVK